MKPITTSANLAPSSGAWLDVDVSALVPVGTPGIVLRIINTSTSYRGIGVRPNGSTVDTSLPGYWQHDGGVCTIIVKLDANRLFEAYISSSVGPEIYAIGYTEPGEVEYFVNPPNIWPATTFDAWTTVDISSYIQAGDVPRAGVFFVSDINSSTSADQAAMRAYGSTDGITYSNLMDYDEGTCYWRKLDSNKKIDVYLGSGLSDVVIFLFGYFKSSNAVFLANPTDVTPASASVWTDLPALAVPGAFGLYDLASSSYSDTGGLRKNGQTAESFTGIAVGYSGGDYMSSTVGAFSDTGGLIEGYRVAAAKLRYFGYVGPMGSSRHPLLLSPF